MKHWIAAARLRTLPLAASSIIMGTFQAPEPDWRLFGLALLTTFLLQVLSNFANDYGDSVHGADHAGRVGPLRQVQQGLISKPQMKTAMIITALAALISGFCLLILAFGLANWMSIALWTLLGLLCIAAAINYTSGKNPYGYKGLGDLAVLIFFGWVGVGGSFYLQTLRFDAMVLVPATAIGLLAVGVLNLNNMRDLESDREAGKKSLALRLGWPLAAHYHAALLGFAGLLLSWFIWPPEPDLKRGLFIASMNALLAFQMYQVYRLGPGQRLDPLLKRLALTTLAISILVGGMG